MDCPNEMSEKWCKVCQLLWWWADDSSHSIYSQYIVIKVYQCAKRHDMSLVLRLATVSRKLAQSFQQVVYFWDSLCCQQHRPPRVISWITKTFWQKNTCDAHRYTKYSGTTISLIDEMKLVFRSPRQRLANYIHLEQESDRVEWVLRANSLEWPKLYQLSIHWDSVANAL